MLTEETESELCLIGMGEEAHSSRDCKNEECLSRGFKEYLRFSAQAFYGDEEKALQEIQSNNLKDQVFSFPESGAQANPSLYASIDSASVGLDSPLEQENAFSPTPRECSNSIHSFSFSKSRKKLPQEGGKEGKLKIIKVRRNMQNEGNSIWDFFCCNFDRS
jgi:hypothetical protein